MAKVIKGKLPKNKFKRCTKEVDTKGGKYNPYVVCMDSIYGKRRLKPEMYRGVKITFVKDGESMIVKFIDRKKQKHWYRFPHTTKERAFPLAKRTIDEAGK